jgi:hypothetical protein
MYSLLNFNISSELFDTFLGFTQNSFKKQQCLPAAFKKRHLQIRENFCYQ